MVLYFLKCTFRTNLFHHLLVGFLSSTCSLVSNKVRALIKAFATFLTYKFLFSLKDEFSDVDKDLSSGQRLCHILCIRMVSSTNSPMLNKARNLVKGFATTLRFIWIIWCLLRVELWLKFCHPLCIYKASPQYEFTYVE